MAKALNHKVWQLHNPTWAHELPDAHTQIKAQRTTPVQIRMRSFLTDATSHCLPTAAVNTAVCLRPYKHQRPIARPAERQHMPSVSIPSSARHAAAR